ncbi:MAG: DUF554 domain-containing protein [Bacteroidota bacterium]
MSKLPIGTFINMSTVVLGSMIGVMLQQVFPENIQAIVFQAMGLGILILGLQMSLKLQEGLMVMFIFSLIIGGVFGELLGVKALLDNCEIWMKTNFQLGERQFSEGLIAALILFCASPITIVGAIEEGFQNKRELMLIKSAFDGIMAVALASSYGIGVLFAILPMLIVQGGITLLAGKAKPLFTKNILALISGIGGVLLIALSIKILKLAEFFVVANLLPALVVCVFVAWGYGRLKVKF